MALCAVTTHDLPTLYGYWKGRDIEVRKKIGGFDEEQWKQQVLEREKDKGLILNALKKEGILPEGYSVEPGKIREMTPELCLAVYRYLSLTHCTVLLVSLDDVMGTLNQQNLPGTVDGHPNWMQKTPSALEDIMKDKRFSDLAGMLKKRA